MNKLLTFYISSLERNMNCLIQTIRSNSIEESYWKPSKDKWSICEIVCHLIDEENKDFRYRLKHVLNHPGVVAPAIDPSKWVIENDYKNQKIEDKLAEFIIERKESIRWLSSLNNPPLDQGFEHKYFGNFNGYLILKNWLAHDLLHLRQIIRNRYQYLNSLTEQSMEYAGNW